MPRKMLNELLNITISFKIIAFLLLHHFAILSQFCEASIFDNVSDRLTLLDIKSHMSKQYPDDDVLSSWNESVDFCLWNGVQCSKTHHRVVGVDLKGKNLYGDVAPSFGNLSFLHDLDLSLNSLTGQVPSELGRLTRLKNLNLSFNSLSGAIPPNISTCSNLINLSLTNNFLSHKIPRELGLLLKLERLYLNNNNLTGNFPSSLGNLSSLEEIDVSYNLMEGEIPNTIGEMKNLTSLLLAINHFSGVFPPAIYNLSSLTLLALTLNNFHGSLRSDIGFLFPNIQQLWLSTGNNFSGQIPISLSNVSTLAELDLSDNYFSGSIPESFANLQNLRYLNLYYNLLGNYSDDDLLFMESLANCSSLQLLDIGLNQFGGKLVASVANLSSQLEWFNVESNNISGSIPEEIAGLVGLTTLSMSLNLLSGNIPASLGALPLLQALDLGDNHLTGEIPSSLGNLTLLLEFYVYNNSLQGSLPSTFSNLKQLKDARFFHNKLNGTIPPQLASLSSLTITLNLSHNSFTGPLPAEVGNLTSLTSLDVSYNHLSGEIPSNLGLCLSLNTLNMENNMFGGKLPDLSRLQGLEYLDLSKNNLTGTIPDYFVNFSSLLNLNMSFNNFQGQVPFEGVFTNETAVQVNDNNNLCGGRPQFYLRPCPPVNKPGRSTRHVKLKLILPLGLVSACLLLLLLFSMLLLCRKKSSRGKHSSKSSLGRTHLRISYKELHDATGGFSSDNLIGAGSFGTVYMGVLGQGEIPVAIKVLNLHQKGASKSFAAECQALGSVRHKNLVKIITVCSGCEYNGNDFKALLYPYMPNGSLDKYLHSEDELSSSRNLNIFQRINIAIDIASALQYLHHGSQFPIIHCDLKPSNVLLDGDLTAHVSDFGLARLLSELRGEDNLNQFSSLGIKGTFGYVAPEYGMGSPLSTAGDVYSYGILLLELFTGRRPVDETFIDNFNLHNLVKHALPDNVVKIIHQSALHDQAVPILEIGIACSAENPQDRINMVQVVHRLVAIKAKIL